MLKSFFLSQALRQGFDDLASLSDAVAWVASSSFPPSTLPSVLRFLHSVLGVCNTFVGAPTTVTLLPLLADAVAKLTRTARVKERYDNSLVSQPDKRKMFFPTADAVCLAHIDESQEPRLPVALCGCALGCLSHGGPDPSIFARFQSFGPASTKVIVVVETEAVEALQRVQQFYNALASVAITLSSQDDDNKLRPTGDPSAARKNDVAEQRVPLHDRRKHPNVHHEAATSTLEDETNDSRIQQFGRLLATSLACFTPPTQHIHPEATAHGESASATIPGSPLDSTTSNDVQTQPHEDWAVVRATWDVLFVSFGPAWQVLFDTASGEDVFAAYSTLLHKITAAEWRKTEDPQLQIHCVKLSLTDILRDQVDEFSRISTLEAEDTISHTAPVELQFKGCAEIAEWLHIEGKFNDLTKKQRLHQEILQEELRFKQLKTFPMLSHLTTLHARQPAPSLNHCPHLTL